MALVILAEMPSQTKERYEQTIAVMGEAIRKAPGFIIHLGHQVDGGWRVIEVWELSNAAGLVVEGRVTGRSVPPGLEGARVQARSRGPDTPPAVL